MRSRVSFPQGNEFRARCDVLQGSAAVYSMDLLLTVVMPCLNEAMTLASCIEAAHQGCCEAIKRRDGRTGAMPYEILIADNGSIDDSVSIAIAHGARVVHIEQKGYGAAVRGGIAAARGRYVVMGDSDCSYDFCEIPRFLEKLDEGFDLVMGNRFAGGIMPGAMPWHHRFIGNPLLSACGRMLYPAACRDWHCGMRGFVLQSIKSLDLSSVGMEFASEMIVGAVRSRLRIAEINVVLHRDQRPRPPHLRSFRDGIRHVWLLVSRYFCYNKNHTST